MLTTFVRREAADLGETDPRPVTLREREIIQLVAEGKSSKQIASLLVRYAIRNGIVGA